MEIPKTKIITLCDSERFIEGLKQLAKECNAVDIQYNAYGPVKFHFGDGSEVGSVYAFIKAGYIDKEIYNNQYVRK